MDKKIALITGATAGIGKESAKQLLEKGIFVIIGARNLEKGVQQLNLLKEYSPDVDMVQIDTTNEDTVVAAANTINDKYGRIDILINNAGISQDMSPVTAPNLEDWKATFDTNVFGTMCVTTHFLPLLKNALNKGRIVNVSSGLGSLNDMTDETHPYSQFTMAAYAASKAALNVYTIHLAKELKKQKIQVNAVCPGYTQSQSNTAEDAQPVEEGAKIPVHYATIEDPTLTGGFFNKFGTQNW